MGGVAAGKKGGRDVDAVFTYELPNHTGSKLSGRWPAQSELRGFLQTSLVLLCLGIFQNSFCSFACILFSNFVFLWLYVCVFLVLLFIRLWFVLIAYLFSEVKEREGS